MDINKIKAVPEKHRMSVHLAIRVSPDIKNWLVENHYSPTAIFHEAIKEIGYTRDDGENIIPTEAELIEQSKDNPDENPGEVYYIKQRVNTRHGWRTKLIKQYTKKGVGHGKSIGLAYRDIQRRKNRR